VQGATSDLVKTHFSKYSACDPEDNRLSANNVTVAA
jgi:hypothetical protein